MDKKKLVIILLICVSCGLLLSAKSCAKRNSNNTKSKSSIDTFIINAPSNLTATAVSSFRIDLSWQDDSNNEDGFEIERSTDGVNYVLLLTLNADTTSYSDTDIQPFITYYYRLRAFNTIGDRSEWSNIVTVYALIPTFTAIGGGYGHSLAVGTDGRLWSWGLNDFWQLGLGDTDSRAFPTQINFDANWEIFNNVVDAVAGGFPTGGSYSIARKSDGTLWGWGVNTAGQLGLGYTENPVAPSQRETDLDWVQIAAGYYHTLGVKNNNTLWSWGNNANGQLGFQFGVGSTALNTLTPTQIGDFSDWSVVVGGGWHTIALKTDRTLWAWGYNWYGQLGLGDNGTDRNTPVQVETISDCTKITAGASHSLTIRNDGTIWSWGNNDEGQLGLGDMGSFKNRNTPTQIGIETEWSIVSAGYKHTIGIKRNSTLWSWGYGGYGQLGLGSVNGNMIPTQIGSSSDWSIVTGGYYHTIGLKNDNTLWTWGWNYFSQLGLGDTINRIIPCRLGSPAPPLALVITIESSSQITLSWKDKSDNESAFIIERKDGSNGIWAAIATAGTNITAYSDVWFFTSGVTYYYRVKAYNEFGESLTSVVVNAVPYRILSPTNLSMTVVSSSQLNLLWTDNSTDETGFRIERSYGGTGSYAEIGTAAADTTIYFDTSVTPDNTYYYRIRAYNTFGNSSYSNEISNILTAPSSLNFTIISNNQVNLFWTDRSYSESGFDIERKIGLTGTWSTTFTVGANITTYSDTTIDISPGVYYYYRVMAYNSLNYSLYSNEIEVSKDIIKGWSSVIAGGYHAFARRTNGTIWSWGQNNYGQLGLGTTEQQIIPSQIGTVSDWSSISAGTYHTLAKKSGNSNLWSWGKNDCGQLGIGDSINRTTPTQIGTGADWSVVSAGSLHSLAKRTNNAICSWGYNNYGQLGLGNIIDRITPTQIGTGTDWSVISAGSLHSLAKRTNNTIWSWGYNNYGQLGLGDTINRPTPTQIGTITNWTQVSAGGLHSLAIDPPKTGGYTLWSWGYNDYGQLGLGHTLNINTPTQIGTATNWSTISAGDLHSLGMRADKTLWSWGRNDNGELGLGDTGINRLTPTQIGTATDWNIISAGIGFSLAIKTDTTLWSWGTNNYGQLGVGNIINRPTPTLIGE